MLKSGSAIANTLFHSTGGGATENNENVFVSATGATSPSRSATSAARRTATRPASRTTDPPYATWQTATYTRAQLSAIFARRRPDERRDADRRSTSGTAASLAASSA